MIQVRIHTRIPLPPLYENTLEILIYPSVRVEKNFFSIFSKISRIENISSIEPNLKSSFEIIYLLLHKLSLYTEL